MERTPPRTRRATACPLCGRADGSPVWREEGRTLVRCPGCDLIRDRRPSAGSPAYWDAPPDPAIWDEARRPLFEAGIAAVRRRLGPGSARVLDVGAGVGYFVERAARAGLEALGWEPEARAVAHGRAELDLGDRLTADRGRVEAEAPFDLVTLWDVVEHAADPPALLREATRWLAPGGLVLVHTPNVRFHLPWARARRALGLGGTLEPGHHLHHFRRETLERLLRAVGATAIERLELPPQASVGPSRARPLVAAKRAWVRWVARPLRRLGREAGPSLDLLARVSHEPRAETPRSRHRPRNGGSP